MTKKSSFGGWLALISSIGLTVVFSGAFGNQMGLLFDPVCTSLGISRTSYSMMISVTTAANFVCSLTFSAFVSKLGLKKMYVFGAISMIVYSALMLLVSNMHGTAALAVLAVAHFFMGVNFSWAGTMIFPIWINNWFAKRNNTLISMISSLGGLSGSVFAPLVSGWILNSGWTSSILYRGIMAVVVTVLFILTKVEPGPNDAKVWADKGEELPEAGAAAGESSAVLEGVMLDEAKKDLRFYLSILTCFGVGCFLQPAANICLPVFATDLGFAANSGTIMSVVMIANLLVTLVVGALIDKIGCKKVFAPIFLIAAVGAFMLYLNHGSLGSMYASAAMLGIGLSMCVVFVPMLTTEAFGLKDFGRIQSFMFSGMVLGMVAGSPLLNIIADVGGSYRLSYLAVAVGCLVMTAVLFIALSRKKA